MPSNSSSHPSPTCRPGHTTAALAKATGGARAAGRAPPGCVCLPQSRLLQPAGEGAARPAFAGVRRSAAKRLAPVDDRFAAGVRLVGPPWHGAPLADPRLLEVA